MAACAPCDDSHLVLVYKLWAGNRLCYSYHKVISLQYNTVFSCSTRYDRSSNSICKLQNKSLQNQWKLFDTVEDVTACRATMIHVLCSWCIRKNSLCSTVQRFALAAFSLSCASQYSLIASMLAAAALCYLEKHCTVAKSACLPVHR
jgi:hypothetical protein